MAIDRNPKSYQREADRVGCTRYEPCPIDGKCRVKASHLYRKCQLCQVPFDNHNETVRNKMILRDPNFLIKESQLGPDAIEAFRNLAKKADA